MNTTKNLKNPTLIMKNFLIKSTHEVFVDDYEKGELEAVNFYNLEEQILEDTPKAAIAKYCNNLLNLNIDFELAELDKEQPHRISYSALVDEDNIPASKSLIEQWKAGEIKLFCNYIDISIYELAPVVIE